MRLATLLLLASAAWAAPSCTLTPSATLFSGASKWTYRTNAGFGASASCTGSGSITYSWAQVGTTPATLSLSNATTSTVSATGNSAFGNYTLRLTATDSNGPATFDIDLGSVPTDSNGKVAMATIDGTNGARLSSVFGPLFIADGSRRQPWFDDRMKYMVDSQIGLRSTYYSGYHNFPLSGTITITGGTATVTGSGTNFMDDTVGICTTAGVIKGSPLIWYQYTGYNDGLTHYGNMPVSSCTNDTSLTLGFAYPANASINAVMEYPRCNAPSPCVISVWGFGWDESVPSSASGYAGVWRLNGSPANYYDNVLAFYKLYYSTGLTAYRTAARSYCDDVWKNPEWDRGQSLNYDYRFNAGVFPARSWALSGLFVCAIEQGDSAMFSAFRTHVYKLGKYYIDAAFSAASPVTDFSGIQDLREMAYHQLATATCVLIETDATAKSGCASALANAANYWQASQGAHGAFYSWWGGEIQNVSQYSSIFTTHAATVANGSPTVTLTGGDTCPTGQRWFVFWNGTVTTKPAYGAEDQTYYTGTCNGTGTVTLSTNYTGAATSAGWAASKKTDGSEGYPFVGWGINNFYNGLLLLAFEQSAASLDGIDNTTRDKYRSLANDIAAFIRDYERDNSTVGIDTFYSPLCTPSSRLLCRYSPLDGEGANYIAAETIGGLTLNALRTGDATIKSLALTLMDENFCKSATGCAGTVSSTYQSLIDNGGYYVTGTPLNNGNAAKHVGVLYGITGTTMAEALTALTSTPSTVFSGTLSLSGTVVIQ